jgi:hypothetical protein
LGGTTWGDTEREIRCYDYVNHPYESVRDALKQNALTVFQSATKTAASRAQSVASELHVDFGGIGVKTDIKIVVRSVEERAPLYDDVATGMGGGDHAAVVSTYEGRTLGVPVDLDRNTVGFFGRL